MAATALSYFTNTLMFATGEMVQAAIENNVLFTKIGQTSAGVVKNDAGHFYVKYTNVFALDYSGGPVAEGSTRPDNGTITNDLGAIYLFQTWIPSELTGLARMAGQLVGDNMVTIDHLQQAGVGENFNKLGNELMLCNHTGALCYVTVGGTTSITVDDAHRLRIGMIVSTVNTAGVEESIGRKITAIDYSVPGAHVLALSSGGGGTALAGDHVVRYLGSTPGNCHNKYPYGLLDIVNDGAAILIDGLTVSPAVDSYAGLSRTTYEKHKATIYRVNGDSSAPISKYHFDATLGMVYRRTQKQAECNLCLGSYNSILAAADCMSLMRIQGATEPLTKVQLGVGGVEVTSMALKQGKIEFGCVPDLMDGIALWLNTKKLTIRKVGEPNWVLNENGQIFHWCGNDGSATAGDTYRGSYMWCMSPFGVPIEQAMTSGFQVPNELKTGY